MNLRSIGIVYRKEMLDSLRDRRTLISMVVVPVLVVPGIIFLMGFATLKMVGKAREETPKVMVLGGEDSPGLLASLREWKEVKLVPASPDYTNQISDKQIRAAVRVPPDFDAALAEGRPGTVEIYVYEGEMKSSFASEALQRFFRKLREETVRERIEKHNLPESILEPFKIERKNVAPPKKVTGNLLGGILPYMVILLCLIGAMYPAMDLTAGEKERGTMETLLSSPVPRTHLVLGKFLTVLSTSVATAVLSLAAMTATLWIAKGMVSGMGDGKGSEMLAVDLASILMVFAMVLPVAVLFAGAELAVALFAKSFKEAQTYLSPLMFLVILPAMFSMTPGIELNFKLSLIPILNTSLVSREIMSGTYHWHYIALIFFSSCAYAAAALGVAVKLFQREDVIFRV